MWPCVSGFFYLTSRFLYVQVLHAFLWLNNIPLRGWNTFCLFMHQLMGIWVVSIFWLLSIMLLWICMYEFLCEYLFICLGYMIKRIFFLLFTVLRNCQTVFQSSCAILHSHKQCVRFPISSPLCQQCFLAIFLIIGIR